MMPMAERQSSGRSRGGAAIHDRSITVFSPEGRLYQVEYAFKAVKLAGFTTVAVCGDDNIFVLTARKSTDKLRNKTSCSHMFAITKRLGLVATGIQADGKALAYEARKEAAEFRLKWGYEMPPHMLAQCVHVGGKRRDVKEISGKILLCYSTRIAARAQICTQHASMRPYGIVSMIMGIDEEKGTPQLFTCDPAGQVFGYKAVSAGLKEREAMDFLEKEMMNYPSLSPESISKIATSALKHALRGDPGVWEVEMGTIRKNNPIFRTGSRDGIVIGHS